MLAGGNGGPGEHNVRTRHGAARTRATWGLLQAAAPHLLTFSGARASFELTGERSDGDGGRRLTDDPTEHDGTLNALMKVVMSG